jgi:hypothetical protein
MSREPLKVYFVMRGNGQFADWTSGSPREHTKEEAERRRERYTRTGDNPPYKVVAFLEMPDDAT